MTDSEQYEMFKERQEEIKFSRYLAKRLMEEILYDVGAINRVDGNRKELIEAYAEQITDAVLSLLPDLIMSLALPTEEGDKGYIKKVEEIEGYSELNKVLGEFFEAI